MLAGYAVEAETIHCGPFTVTYDDKKGIQFKIEGTDNAHTFFNCIYNKNEIDGMIATGGGFSPGAFIKAVLTSGSFADDWWTAFSGNYETGFKFPSGTQTSIDTYEKFIEHYKGSQAQLVVWMTTVLNAINKLKNDNTPYEESLDIIRKELSKVIISLSQSTSVTNWWLELDPSTAGTVAFETIDNYPKLLEHYQNTTSALRHLVELFNSGSGGGGGDIQKIKDDIDQLKIKNEQLQQAVNPLNNSVELVKWYDKSETPKYETISSYQEL